MSTNTETPCWSLRGVTHRPPGALHDIISDASLDIERGRLTALIGPNGAGKTTLLRMLLGTIAPSLGTILFRDKPIETWSRRDLARAIGVVPQSEGEPLFSVRDLVAMGRYPHLGAWQREREEDARAVDHALARCDVAQFADRWMTTLSGGEQQRVRLARALAQEPEILVLDEPTASLDIRHEMAAFELLRRLRIEGTTILVSTHNLNLAARYADTLVLMSRGRILARGAAAVVLTPTRIATVYEWPVDVLAHSSGAPQVSPRSIEPVT
jgi:iron complex transport system ATP-binding protein